MLHTALCRTNNPLLSALCLILTAPTKASSTLVFQSPVAFWAISQQRRKMYFPHSISGIASSHRFKTRKVWWFFLTERYFSLITKFFNAGESHKTSLYTALRAECFSNSTFVSPQLLRALLPHLLVSPRTQRILMGPAEESASEDN